MTIEVWDEAWLAESMRLLRTCGDFLPRVRSDVCHICLQPESAHPSDYDRAYWAAWLIFHVLTDLSFPE